MTRDQQKPSIFHINNFFITQFDGKKEAGTISNTGFYDVAERTGHSAISIQTNKTTLILIQPYLPKDYIPVKVDMDGKLMIDLNGNMISANMEIDAKAEKIVQRQDQTILPSPSFHCTGSMEYDIQQNSFLLENLSFLLKSKDQQIARGKTNGPFRFRRNADHSLDVQKNKASADVSITDFPCSFFDPAIPYRFSAGKIQLTAHAGINEEKERIEGNIQTEICGMAIHDEDKPLLAPHDIFSTCSFQSNGLKNIHKFTIPSFQIDEKKGEERIALYQLSGVFELPEDHFSLGGKLTMELCPFLELLQTPEMRALHRKLRRFHADSAQLNFNLETKVSLTKRRIDFFGSTELDTLILPDLKEKGRKLQIEFSGVSRAQAKEQFFDLHKVLFFIPDLLLFQTNLHARLPENLISSSAELKMLDRRLLRSFCLFFEPEDAYVLECLDRLFFDNISATAALFYNDKKRTITFSNLGLKLLFAPGQDITFTVQKPFSGNVDTMRFETADGKGVVNNFQMSYVNPFIPNYMRFTFNDAPVNGMIHFQLLDFFREIPLKLDVCIEDLTFRKRRVDFHFGDCQVVGDCIFKNWMTSFEYNNAIAKICEQGEDKANIASRGIISFEPPYSADFHLSNFGIQPDYLDKLIPGFSELIYYRSIDTDGYADIKCIDNYDKVSTRWIQSIRKMEPLLPKDDPARARLPLHGELILDYRLASSENSLALRESSLTLLDDNQKKVLHIAADGTWLQNPKQNVTSCSIRSDAADLRLIRHALQATKALTKPQPQVETETVSTPSDTPIWTIDGKEPADIDLADFATKIQLDLRNWSYSDLLTASISGEFLAESNTFRAKGVRGRVNNTADLQFDAFADMSKNDGWEIAGNMKLTKLDLAPIFQAFSGPEQTKDVRGIVDLWELSGKTKGITLASLDKNMQLKSALKIRNFSFPLRDSGTLKIVKVLVMPISFLPRLIEYLPEKNMREYLKKIFGNQLDILSGHKNVELERGEIELSSMPQRRTDLLITKGYLTGSDMTINFKNTRLNPFWNEIDSLTMTTFAGSIYPIHFYGSLTDPQVKVDQFILDYIRCNTRIGNLMENSSSAKGPFKKKQTIPAPQPMKKAPKN